MAQKFYQRALSGDSDEIIAGVRAYLKRRSFAAYCDSVLIPALRLSRTDFVKGQITLRQQAQLRDAIVRAVEALDGAERDHFLSQKRKTVLEEVGSGQLLLQQRMRREHRMADAHEPGADPVVLCIGMGAPGDDLATEVLVRVLRGLHADARHLTDEDLDALRDPGSPAAAISAVCLVTMAEDDQVERGVRLGRQMRSTAPDTYLMALLLSGHSEARDQGALRETVDRMVGSYEQAAHELQARGTRARSTARAATDAVRSATPSADSVRS
jgi:hypothetical protein